MELPGPLKGILGGPRGAPPGNGSAKPANPGRPPHSPWHAGIKAREVVALGNITGNVEASERIEIHKEAKLVGDIRTARIIIEDGAYFKGSIDIVKPEPAKPPAKPAPPPPPHAPAPAAAASPAALPFGAPDVKR